MDAGVKAPGGRGEILALRIAVGLFVVLRLFFDLRVDVLGDEAYYWLWGQHLDWSYFDHPPLHAWLLHLVSLVVGWNPLGPRLLTWISLGGVLLIFRDWARRLAPGDAARAFWRMTAAYLASPLFFAMTAIAFNDHLVVVFSLAAVHGFVLFIERFEARAVGWKLPLYLGAVALGLATLSKYNGALVGVGLTLVLLFRPTLRPVLRTVHPWLAGLLAIAMQAPVLYWNLGNGLASFRFQLYGRWPGVGALHFDHAVYFLLFVAATLSPFLVWPMIRVFRAPQATPFGTSARVLATTVLVLSTLLFCAVSLVYDAYFYWNIVAFASMLPLAALQVRSAWLRWVHIAYGLLVAGFLVFAFAIFPSTSFLGIRSGFIGVNYGWSEIAAHMRAVEAQYPNDRVAGLYLDPVSQLAFALGTTDVVDLLDRQSEFSYWQRGEDFNGQSMLILLTAAEAVGQRDWLAAHFGSVSKLDDFAVTRFGQPVAHWVILRGESFHGVAGGG